MAGAAPTDSQFTRTRNAGPVHCDSTELVEVSAWFGPADLW